MSKAKKNVKDGRKNNGQNPNSIAALKKHQAPLFPPGVSANPGGRPKSVSNDLYALLSEPFPNDPKNRTYLRIMNEGIVKKAAKGDAGAFNAVADRVDGKVGQVISGPDGGGIPVKMSIGELDERLAELFRSVVSR